MEDNYAYLVIALLIIILTVMIVNSCYKKKKYNIKNNSTALPLSDNYEYFDASNNEDYHNIGLRENTKMKCYSDDMHKPHEAHNTSYRPHYDYYYNGPYADKNINLKTFQIYDHLDKENKNLGICNRNLDHELNYDNYDFERNMLIPYAYRHNHNDNKKPRTVNKKPVLPMHKAEIKNNRRVPASMCSQVDTGDMMKLPYSDKIHEHQEMEEPHHDLNTFNEIDTKTSALHIAHKDDSKKTIDDLNHLSKHMDMITKNRLDDIKYSNGKNIMHVKNNKMHAPLLSN